MHVNCVKNKIFLYICYIQCQPCCKTNFKKAVIQHHKKSLWMYMFRRNDPRDKPLGVNNTLKTQKQQNTNKPK